MISMILQVIKRTHFIINDDEHRNSSPGKVTQAVTFQPSNIK
jgi:hypothetical protein